MSEDKNIQKIVFLISHAAPAIRELLIACLHDTTEDRTIRRRITKKIQDMTMTPDDTHIPLGVVRPDNSFVRVWLGVVGPDYDLGEALDALKLSEAELAELKIHMGTLLCAGRGVFQVYQKSHRGVFEELAYLCPQGSAPARAEALLLQPLRVDNKRSTLCLLGRWSLGLRVRAEPKS